MGRSVCGRMFDGVCLFLPFVRGFLPKLAIKSILHIHGSASLWPFVYDFIHPSPLQSSSMSSSFPSRPLWCEWPCLVGTIGSHDQIRKYTTHTPPSQQHTQNNQPKKRAARTHRYSAMSSKRSVTTCKSSRSCTTPCSRRVSDSRSLVVGIWGLLWDGGGERDGWWTDSRRINYAYTHIY
jgi:hypothetical protein